MELIDKKKLIAILNSVMYERHKAIVDEKSSREIALENKTIQHVIGIIEKMPVTESNPVKYGKWVEKGRLFKCWKCSECNGSPLLDKFEREELSDYCPHCGANMNEKK